MCVCGEWSVKRGEWSVFLIIVVVWFLLHNIHNIFLGSAGYRKQYVDVINSNNLSRFCLPSLVIVSLICTNRASRSFVSGLAIFILYRMPFDDLVSLYVKLKKWVANNEFCHQIFVIIW